MDKRLVGKWYKEELGETLNIFDETPLRMKMTFTSSGHYNFEPNCVYEKEGYLCFEINDEKYRMVYHVRFAEGCLEGYYTQFGKETQIRYSLVDKKPEDEPYRFVPTEVYVLETEEKRIDILRKYAAYDRNREEEPYETQYRLGGEMPSVLEKYRFSEYIKDVGPETDEIVFKIFEFVCDHFGHDGSIGLSSGRKAEEIVEFCENHGMKTNCRGLSILLASVLRFCSVKARHITCMPYEDPFNDCHVVVDCLLPSGRRVMLDPTWRLFLKDSEGEYVSVEKLRKILIAGEDIFANKDASYNRFGDMASSEGGFDEIYYRDYMTKNTFRFARGTLCADGCDDHASRRVELIPTGYPAEKFKDSVKEEFVYNDAAFWKM